MLFLSVLWCLLVPLLLLCLASGVRVLFTIVGCWGSKPWKDLMGVPFPIVWRWGSNPWQVHVISLTPNDERNFVEKYILLIDNREYIFPQFEWVW